MKKFFALLAAASCYSMFEAPKDEPTPYEGLPAINVTHFVEGYIKSPVDHFNYQSKESYQQRYFANEEFCEDKSTCPIFVYICGEYECSVRDDRKFPFMVGASHGAAMYAVEHRFYGKSQPFKDWSIENLRYLTTEQALADLAHFIHLKTEGTTDRQVVVVGGSYPGALSAWFREKYPQMTVASWASSGVVYPIEDFWQFDAQIYTATHKSGPECSLTIQRIMAHMESILGQGSSSDKKETMAAMGVTWDMDRGDFAFFFSDIFVEAVQYGKRTQLCDIMKTVNVTSWQEGGWLDTVKAIKELGDSQGASPSDYCRESLKNTTINMGSGRQWTYQYCTEFGWFQTPSKEYPMRPTLLGLDYWTNYCKDIYNVDLHINRTIEVFSENGLHGTNTIFTNGIDDPWQWATELEVQSRQGEGSMADCTDCGHCGDLGTPKESDPKELIMQRKLIIKFLNEQLKDVKSSESFMFLQN